MDRLTSLTILVVEDDAAVRALLARFLGLKGCRVEAVGDGAAALRAIAEQEFDAVVTDVNLPIVDGLALWNAVAAERPVLARRFVFTSALAPPAEALRAAGRRFVAKPFHLERLWDLVREAMDGPPPGC